MLSRDYQSRLAEAESIALTLRKILNIGGAVNIKIAFARNGQVNFGVFNHSNNAGTRKNAFECREALLPFVTLEKGTSRRGFLVLKGKTPRGTWVTIYTKECAIPGGTVVEFEVVKPRTMKMCSLLAADEIAKAKRESL